MLIKVMGALALLFTATLGAMRTQPHDDGGLRAFLLPEDCNMPCWLGIRPGVTTTDEALAILRAHPWIERVVVEERQPTATFLYLVWNQQAPAFVAEVDSPLPPYLSVERNIIQLIMIPTRIPYADAWWLMGTPGVGLFKVSGYRSANEPGYRPNTVHSAMYFDRQVVFDTRVFCPVNPDMFWRAPVTISFNSPHTKPSSAGKPYNLIRWFYSAPCKS